MYSFSSGFWEYPSFKITFLSVFILVCYTPLILSTDWSLKVLWNGNFYDILQSQAWISTINMFLS